MSELPRGWGEDEAWNICELVQSGGTPKEGFIDKPGVPFLKVYNIVDQKIDFEYRPQFIDVDIHRSSMAKSQAYPGDVLMNIVGPPLGKVAVIPDSFPTWNVNQALTIFRPSEAVTSEWLYYFLCGGNSVKSVINETRGSAGQVNISLSQCRAFKLPLPPLAEQKRIVAKLDALNAKSARARTELARIETLVSRYKQAVLSKAFSGDLTREWRKVASTVWPWRSEFWGDCGETLNGRAFPSGDYCESGVRLLRPGNLGASGDVFWNEKNSRFLPDKYAVEFPKHFIKGEEILINLTAQSLEDQFLARACLSSASDEFMLNQRIGLFRPRNMIPKFCLFALKSPRFRGFVDNGMNSGSLIQHVHTKQLEQYEFEVPDIEEQHEIVRRIESAFAKIDRLAKEAERALELVGRLDEAILAKAFRGELVRQDENVEPAEHLLARIRAERETAPKTKRGRRARA
ncbi:restriction endonuclease subunit S [Rhizobium sp.]|uniref:restriction endonuclease subunit S n=1 Tax=Rhizobium sp. TaxID=391 RepID=UPI002F186637